MNQLAMDFTPERGRIDRLEFTLIDVHREAFAADFALWLVDNWHIWREFKRTADEVRAKGREHYSARVIGEVMRHHTVLAERTGEWKLNDHRWPDLARLYMLVQCCPGFFETRVQRDSAKRAA